VQILLADDADVNTWRISCIAAKLPNSVVERSVCLLSLKLSVTISYVNYHHTISAVKWQLTFSTATSNWLVYQAMPKEGPYFLMWR